MNTLMIYFTDGTEYSFEYDRLVIVPGAISFMGRRKSTDLFKLYVYDMSRVERVEI